MISSHEGIESFPVRKTKAKVTKFLDENVTKLFNVSLIRLINCLATNSVNITIVAISIWQIIINWNKIWNKL